jgi:hypothetical protein
LLFYLLVERKPNLFLLHVSSFETPLFCYFRIAKTSADCFCSLGHSKPWDVCFATLNFVCPQPVGPRFCPTEEGKTFHLSPFYFFC